MSVELTTVKGGINLLRTKGKARSDSLFKLTNGFVTPSGTINVRPGTTRTAALPAGTRGLTGFAGKFHVFAESAPGLEIDGTWTGDDGFTVVGGVATFEGGVIVAMDGLLTSEVLRSADGITWSAITGTNPVLSNGARPVWSEDLGQFWAVRSGFARSFSSTDGNDWDEHVTNLGQTLRSTTRVDDLGLFVFGSEGPDPIWTSPDGITWTQRTCPEATISAFAWNGSILVAVNSAGGVFTSPDAINWTQQTAAIATDVVWAEELGLFVGIGDNVVQTSPDGITWTSRTFDSANIGNLSAIAWNGAVLCVVPNQNVVNNAMTSPDGITWTLHTAIAGGWNDVEWFNDLFVAIEGSSDQDIVMTSPDGVTWTQRALPTEAGSEIWQRLVIGSSVITPGTLTAPLVSWASGNAASASVQIRASTPTIGGRVGLSWFDGNSTLISTTYADDYTMDTGGAFVESAVAATAPEGTAFAAVTLQANGPAEFQSLTTTVFPDDFVLHLLPHPDGQVLKKIHFTKPYLGALYVVAEFVNDDVYHYWLQAAEAWEASTEYSANQFVTPTTPNGLAYKATRLGDPNPSWAPNVPRVVGALIEPTTYNEYYYEAVETNGDSPRSAGIEPIWPTNTGETIVENSETAEADENTSVSPPAPPSANNPQTDTLERYRRSLAGFASVKS